MAPSLLEAKAGSQEEWALIPSLPPPMLAGHRQRPPTLIGKTVYFGSSLLERIPTREGVRTAPWLSIGETFSKICWIMVKVV